MEWRARTTTVFLNGRHTAKGGEGEYEKYLFLKTYSRTAIYERGNRGMSGMRSRASGQDMKSSAVVSWQQERRENKQSPIDPLIANSLIKGGNPTLLFRTHRPLYRNLLASIASHMKYCIRCPTWCSAVSPSTLAVSMSAPPPPPPPTSLATSSLSAAAQAARKTHPSVKRTFGGRWRVMAAAEEDEPRFVARDVLERGEMIIRFGESYYP